MYYFKDNFPNSSIYYTINSLHTEGFVFLEQCTVCLKRVKSILLEILKAKHTFQITLLSDIQLIVHWLKCTIF